MNVANELMGFGRDAEARRLNDLRHPFATCYSATESRVPINYVAAQLGHARPTTTLT